MKTVADYFTSLHGSRGAGTTETSGCPALANLINTIIDNDFITIKNIPFDAYAYDYIVNGKPALEWVMERQAVTTDNDSGITNDANLWATETMGNPKYPLELFLRVVTVSLETNRIVAGLPGLEIVNKQQE